MTPASQMSLIIFFIAALFAGYAAGPAGAVAGSPVAATIAPPPDYWVRSSHTLAFTDDTVTISWKGPEADNVSLSYIINGKEYPIARARGDRASYSWNVPDKPVPSDTFGAVYHYVKIKAVWQKVIKNSAGKSAFQNITTEYSDYFTIAKPGAFVISTTELPAAYHRESYNYYLHAVGGETPYHWDVKEGYRLPAGLTLDDNGRLHGTPSDSESGPHNVRFRVGDSGVDIIYDEMDLVLYVLDRDATGTPRPDEPFNYILEMSDYRNNTTIERSPADSATAHKTLNVRWTSGIPQTVSLSATGCPAGLDCSFSPRMGSPFFASAMNITAHNTLAPGTYPIVVHATTGSGMEKTLTYTVNVVTGENTTGDLILERPYHPAPSGLAANIAIQPIQAFPDNDYIIKGKNTIFKATVRSTFNTDMDVRVELWLPTEDWEWEGMPHGSSVDIRTEDMGTYRFPEHYIYNRTITVPANSAVEVFLPEPSELAEETIHSSPHGYMDELTVVTNAPRPKHSGGADYFDEPEYTVIVDPANRIAETNERNNCPWHGTEWIQTHPTSSLYLFISPVISDEYEVGDFWPGGVTGSDFAGDFNDVIRPQARNGSEFMLGVYPVADDKLSYFLSEGVATFHEHGGETMSLYMQQDMADMAAENGYDRYVGMVPEGFSGAGWDEGDWLGVVYGLSNSRACFVMIDRNCTMVMVHENYHNLGYGDVYGDLPVPASDGYWVNEQRTFDVSANDVRDYMERVLVDPDYNYTMISRPYWTSKYRFDRVMWTMPFVEDPEVLLFRCVLHKNGSVGLDPFMIVDGKPDAEPEAWNYKVVLKDASGRVVREQKENVSFTVSVASAKGAGGTKPFDTAFISSLIPWSDNVTLVELQDKSGEVVASRAVSRNPPVVEFTAPAGGDVWEHGKAYKLKWNATDPDGDALNFSLAMSTDKVTWVPVAIDVASSEYAFNTSSVQPGDYYFRVRATDGVLCANDTMEQSIRITGESALPARSGTPTPTTVPQQPGLPGATLLIGGVIALVLIVVAIGAAFLVLRPRK